MNNQNKVSTTSLIVSTTASAAAAGLNQNIPNIGGGVERVVPERVDRMDIRADRVDNSSPPPPPPASAYGGQQPPIREPPPDTKPWGYSGLDLMNTGAAFWQNYSGA